METNENNLPHWDPKMEYTVFFHLFKILFNASTISARAEIEI